MLVDIDCVVNNQVNKRTFISTTWSYGSQKKSDYGCAGVQDPSTR